ncbi:ParB-like protein [Paraburkholderia youngii]|uniref:ParB-like protein n=1 Tax=Paraburkholderia youngii TaxID=2782701 RepID=UPI003D1F2AF0
MIDHHHLAQALWDGRITKAFAEVADDLSGLSDARFWDTGIRRPRHARCREACRTGRRYIARSASRA